jgi:hypothetical protein
MAYSKTPSMSTYSTERSDLIVYPQNRIDQILEGNNNKDSNLVNMFVEVYPNPNGQNTRTTVRSRPGLSKEFAYADGLSGVPRGTYSWLDSSNNETIYSVVANRLYRGDTLLATLTTTTGRVGFVEHVNDVGAVTLFMCDGLKGYTFANSAAPAVAIVDANFPSPHITDPVVLDGYIFLAKAGTQDIYNSELNTPSSWSEGGIGGPMYISAEMYADVVVALAKNNNYVYAIGTKSIEYFFDAANSTGSPLERYPSAIQQFGTPAAGSVVQTESSVVLVGDTNDGGYTVWAIDGFKPKEIASTFIKEYLSSFNGSSFGSFSASCIRVAGQKFYILNIATLRTFVYSFDTELWAEWTTNSTAFGGVYFSATRYGKTICLDRVGTGVLSFGQLNFIMYDGTVSDYYPIICKIVTTKYDFGSLNRKTMSRFALIGDVPSKTYTQFNNFSVQWSDDDYNTWSSARTIAMGNDYPGFSQLGNFRRRAFKITYTPPAFDLDLYFPMLIKLEGIEMDINKGNQ